MSKGSKIPGLLHEYFPNLFLRLFFFLFPLPSPAGALERAKKRKMKEKARELKGKMPCKRSWNQMDIIRENGYSSKGRIIMWARRESGNEWRSKRNAARKRMEERNDAQRFLFYRIHSLTNPAFFFPFPLFVFFFLYFFLRAKKAPAGKKRAKK